MDGESLLLGIVIGFIVGIVVEYMRAERERSY